MTQEEIITRLINCLEFHLHSTASVHQNPYKNDIFKLFREAYNSGYCEHTSRPLLTGATHFATLCRSAGILEAPTKKLKDKNLLMTC